MKSEVSEKLDQARFMEPAARADAYEQLADEVKGVQPGLARMLRQTAGHLREASAGERLLLLQSGEF